MREFKTLALLFLIIFVAESSVIDTQAQKKAILTGIVLDDDGSPIIGANVTLLTSDRHFFVKRVKTDSVGRFYVSINKEGSYLVYVTYDNKETPGMDYVPERWRTWLSLNSISSRQFVLKKGASIYLDGQVRHIETNKAAINYQFTVLELKESSGKNYWTGPIREYGSFSDFVRALGFDERLVVVPADTEVKIRVRANFPAKYSQTFILAGKTGYYKLSQGETLHIDIREQNIISNIEYVKEILSSGFSLLDKCLTTGFLVEVERRDLFKAYDAIEESLFLLKKGAFDQSFAKLRSAYILAIESENTLKGLIESSFKSLFPLLFLFLIVAFASAHLIVEKSICLEITAGDKRLLIPITSIMEIVLYILLCSFFYLVFPGCHLVPQLTYISMGILIYIAGKTATFLFPRLVHEEESKDQPIQLKSAIIAAFSIGSRNLRRRKVRTAINLISIMIFIFGFITLTSVSPRYGLSKIMLKSILPVNALLVRDVPYGGYVGEFISLPNSFIEWLESHPNVTLVSPKAENSPVSFDSPLGYLYSSSGGRMTVLGVIGIIPSREENITGVNLILDEGNFLEDDDPKGILISSSLRESLKVDVGDKLYGFGQEFVIRGFFNEDALSKIVDIDGRIYLPYYKPSVLEGEAETLPCPGDDIVILNYEKALTFPKVSTSRVVVQLSNIKDYETFAEIIAFTYNYRVYVSHPRFLVMYLLGEYIEEWGIELIFPLMVLVMLNIGMSMFATVNERKNEIASLSSVGLNPTHIAALFIGEALIIGFIGGGFGYLLGILGYRLAFILGGLQVREKISAEWGLVSIFISVLTAIIASLIPALHSSTIITPSLSRRWSIRKHEHPIKANIPWVFDLPIRLAPRELEPFITFIVKRLQEEGEFISSRVGEVKIKKELSEKWTQIKISFEYYLPEKGGRTKNDIIIQKEKEGYDLKLISIAERSRAHSNDLVYRTASYVRKLILEWSAATCEVVAFFDPYLSRLYNIIYNYNPTTLYLISTHKDIYDKLETLKKTLIKRNIRPPKFAVSYVNPRQELGKTIKTVKDLVSRAEIICVSAENDLLCSILTMEAVKQNKIICYVIDNRSIEERMKNPFQHLKTINIVKKIE